LWTPHAERGKKKKREEEKREEQAAPRRRARRLPRATVEQTIQLVSGPGMQPVSPEPTRGEAPVPPGSTELKLVEQNGLRYWATVDEQGQLKPLSQLSESLQNEKVRGMLGAQRGVLDYAKVVGRWVVGKITGSEKESLLLRLVEQYDRETVPAEQLLLISPDMKLTPLPQPPAHWDWLNEPLKPGQDDRVLLIIHGTFSKTESPVVGLGKEFFEWAYKQYRGVIGFDHWTLSKTPEDNARMLWDRLDPRLRSGRRLDIITHSRGGLVARAFVELLRHGAAVRRVVFVGTPNAGTNLANPENWGRVADEPRPSGSGGDVRQTQWTPGAVAGQRRGRRDSRTASTESNGDERPAVSGPTAKGTAAAGRRLRGGGGQLRTGPGLAQPQAVAGRGL
jgi:hypothetical protein